MSKYLHSHPNDSIVVRIEDLSLNQAMLIEKVEALTLAVKSLENRLLAVERATPWKAPKQPKRKP